MRRTPTGATIIGAAALAAVLIAVTACGGGEGSVTTSGSRPTGSEPSESQPPMSPTGEAPSETFLPDLTTPPESTVPPSRYPRRALPTAAPARGSGPTGLTISVQGGTGATAVYSLSCDPPGGDHPDPAAACSALEAGYSALWPVPPDQMCTQIYGGPQTASVTGTFRGQAVNAALSQTNGCEIFRWQSLSVLLGPAGDGSDRTG